MFMTNEEDRRWARGSQKSGPERLTPLLLAFKSREPLVLVLLAVLMFTILATGQQLGLW